MRESVHVSKPKRDLTEMYNKIIISIYLVCREVSMVCFLACMQYYIIIFERRCSLVCIYIFIC